MNQKEQSNNLSSHYNKPLSTVQAAKFLEISISTLYKKTSNGEIKFYKPGGKIMYFFEEDLIKHITAEAILTKDEIDEKATNIMMNLQKKKIVPKRKVPKKKNQPRIKIKENNNL